VTATAPPPKTRTTKTTIRPKVVVKDVHHVLYVDQYGRPVDPRLVLPRASAPTTLANDAASANTPTLRGTPAPSVGVAAAPARIGAPAPPAPAASAPAPAPTPVAPPPVRVSPPPTHAAPPPTVLKPPPAPTPPPCTGSKCA
jgi:hypothetical protein